MSRSRFSPGSLVGLILGGLIVSSGFISAEPTPSGSEGTGRVLRGHPPMPEILWFKPYYQDAVFVSSERLFLESGVVDRSLLQEGWAFAIERFMERTEEDGCVRVNSADDYFDSPPADVRDLESALGQSDTVLRGVVSGTLPGFSFSRPGTLVRITTTEALKGQAPGEDRLIFFPLGVFEAQGKQICVENSSWPDLPDLGDQVVLWYRSDANYAQGPSLVLGPYSLAIFRRTNALSLASLIEKADSELQSLSLENFLARVESLVHEEGE